MNSVWFGPLSVRTAGEGAHQQPTAPHSSKPRAALARSQPAPRLPPPMRGRLKASKGRPGQGPVDGRVWMAADLGRSITTALVGRRRQHAHRRCQGSDLHVPAMAAGGAVACRHRARPRGRHRRLATAPAYASPMTAPARADPRRRRLANDVRPVSAQSALTPPSDAARAAAGGTAATAGRREQVGGTS